MGQTILPQSLQRLVDMLSEATANGSTLNPEKVKDIVNKANVQVEDMMHYADFNHPLEDCYGRKMVFDNGNFEVMVMSWNPGDYSSIHNHGYTQWGVVQAFGHVHHMIYNTRNDELRFSKREILPSGTVVKVNNALIHQMGNASTDPYLTLHVYGCNDRDENVTADAKTFEIENNRIAHTTGGAFFNLPEDQVYDFEPLPPVSSNVLIHQAGLLLGYYNRLPESSQINAKKMKVIRMLEEDLLVKA